MMSFKRALSAPPGRVHCHSSRLASSIASSEYRGSFKSRKPRALCSSSRMRGVATSSMGGTLISLPLHASWWYPSTASEAESRSAPECTALSVRRYSFKSRVRPSYWSGLNEGSEQILRSYDAMRAASMPLACRWSQYTLMSQSAAMNFSSASQIGTSSGDVLLCSFWCHSSIIPPLQLFVCCTARISSRMRWPTSPSPPRPMVAMVRRVTSRSDASSRWMRASCSVHLSCAAEISRGLML